MSAITFAFPRVEGSTLELFDPSQLSSKGSGKRGMKTSILHYNCVNIAKHFYHLFDVLLLYISPNNSFKLMMILDR